MNLIRVYITRTGEIVTLDIETEYLPFVVAAENAAAPWESMKAQAVASRTVAYYKLLNPSGDNFDIYDDERDQVYNPSLPLLDEHIRSVSETKGVHLKYADVIIFAFYVSGLGDYEQYVTYNEGKSGDDITQTTLGWTTDPPSLFPYNRGCMGQVQANALAEDRGYTRDMIFRYFYGEDIVIASLEDTTPPTVTDNAPTGVNAPITTQISVAFSEAMNQTSAESAFSMYPATPGSFSWNSNSTIMTFTPASVLASDTIHVVTIGTGAMDLAGNVLQAPHSWQFTTAYLDTTPPTVTGNAPTGVNVPITTQISVAFSEAMNQTSAESAFSMSPATPGSFSWNSNSTIMTFTPASVLASDTIYVVTIGTGAMDLAGNVLQAPHSWQFTTASLEDTTVPSRGFESPWLFLLPMLPVAALVITRKISRVK